jgi:hypothetical protein
VQLAHRRHYTPRPLNGEVHISAIRGVRSGGSGSGRRRWVSGFFGGSGLATVIVFSLPQ